MKKRTRECFNTNLMGSIELKYTDFIILKLQMQVLGNIDRAAVTGLRDLEYCRESLIVSSVVMYMFTIQINLPLSGVRFECEQDVCARWSPKYS